jgi:Sulfotransferase family
MLSGFRRFTRTHLLKHCLAGRFSQNSVFIQSSSPRSGSTLLSQVLRTIPQTCVLFEPEHAEFVPAAKAAQFSQQAYVDPQTNWPAGEAFLRQVFSGRVINKWTVGQMTVRDIRAERMIVKLVRANRLLPWICRTFKIVPPVLLIRHPCAVVASQLKYHWNCSQRPKVPQHLEKYPLLKSALAKMQEPEEFLAADWALDQLVALNQPRPHPWITITYEELLLRPEPTLAKIAENWNVELDMDLAMSRLRRPSSTVSKSGIRGISGWKKDLSDKQVSRILGVAKEFGLGFYTLDDEADYAALPGEQLAFNVQKPAAA